MSFDGLTIPCLASGCNTKEWHESCYVSLYQHHTATLALQPPLQSARVSSMNSTEQTMVKKALEQECFRLWACQTDQDESPFMGIVLSKLHKVVGPDIQGIPTAAVGYNKQTKNIDLFINTKYVLKLINWCIEKKQNCFYVGSILKHEIIHVICNHVQEFSEENNKILTKIKNIAMDLVVNQYVLPGRTKKDYSSNSVEIDSYVFPDWYYPGRSTEMGDELDKVVSGLPPGLSWREYYELIKHAVDENSQSSMDGHMIGDMSPEEKQVLKEKISFILKEAAKELTTRSNSFGHLPQDILSYLGTILQPPKQNWKSLLKHFISSAQSVDREGTVHRTNRRMPGMFPGSRRKQTASIVVFIDQSGSMSDEDIQQVIPEINGMGDHVKKIDVYNFDTSVDIASHSVWEKNKPKKWVRTRCGGTNFDCIADLLAKPPKQWTGAIVYTDGYAAPMKHLKMKAKILYLITKSGNLDQSMVKHTDIVVKM